VSSVPGSPLRTVLLTVVVAISGVAVVALVLRLAWIFFR
jgi:hypothetical protein